jgi:hypothetical protein
MIEVRRQTWPLTFVIGCVTLCGCGSDTAKVSGKVFYKDGTVPKGEVCALRFEPTQESTAKVRKAASGAIGPDGSFELNTRQAGDGVHKGEYAVTFVVRKSAMEGGSLVAEKYTNAATTPYKVTVDRNLSALKFEIEPPGAEEGGEKIGGNADAAKP